MTTQSTLNVVEDKLSLPQLRDYQRQVISDVYATVRANEKRILVVAPTGAGKTIMASKIVYDAVSRNRNVLFVVSYDVLVKQTHKAFSKWGLQCGFIKAGMPEDRTAKVQIASAQSLNRREWWKNEFIPDVIILDEAHETAWIKVISNMLEDNPQAFVLGLTATPYRLSKKQSMSDKFAALVCAPLPSELINQGHLVQPIYYSVKGVDLTTIGISGGDYAQDELGIVMNDPEVIMALVENWKRLASDRITMIFAVDIEHSKAIAKTFQNEGINIIHVDGSFSTKDREEIYGQLAREEINGIVSCQVTQIGFDCPRVDCVVFDRPSKSSSIVYQQLGRGLRPFTNQQTGWVKKDCIFLDQAGHFTKKRAFLPVEQITSYTLGRSNTETGEAPMKACPECGHLSYGFVQVCPQCQFRFPPSKKQKEKPKGQLIRLNVNPQDVKTAKSEDKKRTLQIMLKVAVKQGCKPGSVYFKYFEIFNQNPPNAYYLGALFGSTPSIDNKEWYWGYLMKVYDNNIVKARPWFTKEFGVDG